jgi:hypothetical protein
LDVEPVGAEPDLAQQGVLEIPPGAQGTPVVALSYRVCGAPPRRWRSRVATTACVTVVYLVSAGALLTWGVPRQMDQTMPPGPAAPAVVGTNASVVAGQAPVAGAPHPTNDAPASGAATAPAPAPKADTANAQSEPASPADEGASQAQATETTQPAPIDIATQPLPVPALPPSSADDLPHRCSNGQWTWSTCSARPRRVAWHWVRRCAVKLGDLCLGASYVRVK